MCLFSLFSGMEKALNGKGREAVGVPPALAGYDANNKEVPLNARESHFEMQ